MFGIGTLFYGMYYRMEMVFFVVTTEKIDCLMELVLTKYNRVG